LPGSARPAADPMASDLPLQAPPHTSLNSPAPGTILPPALSHPLLSTTSSTTSSSPPFPDPLPGPSSQHPHSEYALAPFLSLLLRTDLPTPTPLSRLPPLRPATRSAQDS